MKVVPLAGVALGLIASVMRTGRPWLPEHTDEADGRKRGCKRMWLNTDPVNPAIRAWPPLGFASLGVRKDFKGPGMDRELFERRLP